MAPRSQRLPRAAAKRTPAECQDEALGPPAPGAAVRVGVAQTYTWREAEFVGGGVVGEREEMHQ